MYYGVHHVQLAMPPGREDAARDFFIGVLGLTELAKRLAAAGYPVTWDGELEGVAVYLNGRTPPPVPSHAAGMHRCYTTDPFGNRLEFLAPVETT